MRGSRATTQKVRGDVKERGKSVFLE